MSISRNTSQDNHMNQNRNQRPVSRRTAEKTRQEHDMENNNNPSDLQRVAEAIYGRPEEDWPIPPDPALRQEIRDRTPEEIPESIPEDNTGTDISGTTGNLLVHYSTRRIGLSVTHKGVTNDNCIALNASPEALRTTAKLFKSANSPIGQILSLFANTRISLSKLGLRLNTGGYLTRANQLELVRGIFDEADDELERLKGEVRRQYQKLVDDAKRDLGDSATGMVWPSPEETAGAFTHRLDYVPDPTSGEVLLEGVSEEVAAKVRAEVEKSRQHMLEAAHSNLIKELLSFLTGSGEKDQGILGVLGSDCVLKRGRFERLKERLEQAKKLNWIELPQLDEAIKTLEPIASADLDELRANDYKRKELESTARKAVDSVTKNSLATLGITI